jgi:hypothetical protein
MEELSSALFLDQVPTSWAKKAYPSMLSLGPWYADLLQRIRELESWSSDFIVRISSNSILCVCIKRKRMKLFLPDTKSGNV